MFSPNILGLNLWRTKKGKTVLNAFIKSANESNQNQINYGLIKEENFTIKLGKNR